MQRSIKLSIGVITLLISAVVLALAYQPSMSADEAEVIQEAEVSPETSEYTYRAQSGDSYTQLARKAVQTYGINNNINLTPAGIIYAETNLTHEASSGNLTVGQEVSIDAQLVKKWVESAQNLPKSEQVAWNAYVPFVNFNTDNIGE